MSVVQRCPNCGTTQANSGDCEACHEAHVRYFCTNHTPGIWLEAPTCGKCGARFGESPHRATAPAPAPVRARSPAPARSPVPTSTTPPSYSRTVPPSPSTGAWHSHERLRPVYEPELGARTPLWQQLLRAAIRARTLPPMTLPERGRPRIARAAGGCFLRLLLAVVLMIVALISALFLFGQSVL